MSRSQRQPKAQRRIRWPSPEKDDSDKRRTENAIMPTVQQAGWWRPTLKIAPEDAVIEIPAIQFLQKSDR